MIYIIVAGLILTAVAIVFYAVGIYNGLIQVQNNVDKSWANIDVILKQRYDEIPKLVAICEGYKEFERKTLQSVIQARNQYVTASTPNAKVAAASDLSGAVRGLFAVAEAYPDLKTNQNFLQLQNRVSTLEDQIADRREFYNDSVNTLNIRIRQLPDVFVATALGIQAREMYKVTDVEKQDVPIQFKP